MKTLLDGRLRAIDLGLRKHHDGAPGGSSVRSARVDFSLSRLGERPAGIHGVHQRWLIVANAWGTADMRLTYVQHVLDMHRPS